MGRPSPSPGKVRACFEGGGDLLWVTGPVLPQAGVWGAGAFSGLADRSMQAEKAGSPRPAAP